MACKTVVGRAARDRVHQVFAGERLDRTETFRRKPGVEHFDETIPYQARVQHPAVEQNVRRRGKTRWAAAYTLVLG